MFVPTNPTCGGLCAWGLADGDRGLAGTDKPGAIGSYRSRVLGRVSMDMITIELDVSREGLGDEVELWGDVVHVNEVAAAAGTIAYELLCNVKRAKFTYFD